MKSIDNANPSFNPLLGLSQAPLHLSSSLRAPSPDPGPCLGPCCPPLSAGPLPSPPLLFVCLLSAAPHNHLQCGPVGVFLLRHTHPSPSYSLRFSDLSRSVVPTHSAPCGVCLLCDCLFHRQPPDTPPQCILWVQGAEGSKIMSPTCEEAPATIRGEACKQVITIQSTRCIRVRREGEGGGGVGEGRGSAHLCRSSARPSLRCKCTARVRRRIREHSPERACTRYTGVPASRGGTCRGRGEYM